MPIAHFAQCARDDTFLCRNILEHKFLLTDYDWRNKDVSSTEDREDGGDDRCRYHQTLRQRAHPVKVDEKCNFNESVDRPHGKVGHEANPRQPTDEEKNYILALVGSPLPVMSQNHHRVGQSLVQDHSDQPEGKEDRAGRAVDVSWDHVDPGCKHQISTIRRAVGLGFYPAQSFFPGVWTW